MRERPDDGEALYLFHLLNLLCRISEQWCIAGGYHSMIWYTPVYPVYPVIVFNGVCVTGKWRLSHDMNWGLWSDPLICRLWLWLERFKDNWKARQSGGGRLKSTVSLSHHHGWTFLHGHLWKNSYFLMSLPMNAHWGNYPDFQRCFCVLDNTSFYFSLSRYSSSFTPGILHLMGSLKLLFCKVFLPHTPTRKTQCSWTDQVVLVPRIEIVMWLELQPPSSTSEWTLPSLIVKGDRPDMWLALSQLPRIPVYQSLICPQASSNGHWPPPLSPAEGQRPQYDYCWNSAAGVIFGIPLTYLTYPVSHGQAKRGWIQHGFPSHVLWENKVHIFLLLYDFLWPLSCSDFLNSFPFSPHRQWNCLLAWLFVPTFTLTWPWDSGKDEKQSPSLLQQNKWSPWDHFIITLFQRTVQTRPGTLTRLQLNRKDITISLHWWATQNLHWEVFIISLSLFCIEKSIIPNTFQTVHFRERPLSLLCQDTVDICFQLSRCVTSLAQMKEGERETVVIIIHLFSPRV